MRASIALPADVVQALGRVAWVSMNLEDWTKSACELVLRQFDTRIHIGEHIRAAIAEAGTWPQTPELEAAIAWLSEAQAAMIRRNHVLHAVPQKSTEDPSRPSLLYFPKLDKRTQTREPPILTPLEVDALTAVSDQMEAAIDGWRETFVALSHARR